MSTSYFVRYRGQFADPERFLDYYAGAHAGILAEFPPEHFPTIAAAVDVMQVWFTWLVILVALSVVVVSTVFNSDQKGGQEA